MYRIFRYIDICLNWDKSKALYPPLRLMTWWGRSVFFADSKAVFTLSVQIQFFVYLFEIWSKLLTVHTVYHNWFWCPMALFHCPKYLHWFLSQICKNHISIRHAQKSDLYWQSKAKGELWGLRVLMHLKRVILKISIAVAWPHKRVLAS